MALEPITRQEQIIAGKDLEPITRMEKFLKEYGGGGGASSWNELTDRPFGEVTTYGDTLTWDGNTEGRELVPLEANAYFCHVSDAVPTLEDIAGGISGTVYYNQDGVEGEAQIPISSFQLADGCIMLTDSGDGMIGAVVSESVVGTDLEGLVFNRAGLYLLIVNMPTLVTYTSSLTINGYSDFEATTIEQLDPKYVPKQSTFFHTKPLSDTDVYLYADSSMSQKATNEAVREATTKGLICVKIVGMAVTYPLFVEYYADYTVVAVPMTSSGGTLKYKSLYTAEYTG